MPTPTVLVCRNVQASKPGTLEEGGRFLRPLARNRSIFPFRMASGDQVRQSEGDGNANPDRDTSDPAASGDDRLGHHGADLYDQAFSLSQWPEHERAIHARYESAIARGLTPVIMDCGAHIGLATLWSR